MGINNFIKEHSLYINLINNLILCCLCFILINNILPNIVYPFLIYADIPIGRFFVFFISLCSLLLSYPLFSLIKEEGENRFYLLLLFVPILYYFYYVGFSPIIEQRQDPGAYLHKSYNLLNFGVPYRDLSYLSEIPDYKFSKGYRGVLRGSIVKDYKLIIDFFYGPTLNYFHWGSIFPKKFLAFTPFSILLSLSFILFLILKKFLSTNWETLLLILILLISPPLIFFGRASYSEPVSMLVFLSYLFILLKDNFKYKNVLLILLAAIAYLIRIDFIFLCMLTIFFLTKEKIHLGIISIIIFLLIHEIATVNEVYWNRISRGKLFFFKYYYLIYLASFMGALIEVKLKLFAKYIRNSYFFLVVNIIIVLLCVISLYLDDISILCSNLNLPILTNYLLDPPGRQNDLNLELLMISFPSTILFISFIYFPKFIKNGKLSDNVVLFLVFYFLLSFTIIDHIRNSQYLYWCIRRFFIFSIPVWMIIFAAFLEKIDSLRVYIMIGISLVWINFCLRNIPQPEYQDLLISADRYLEKIPEENTLGYLVNENVGLSPIINRFHGKILPLSFNDYQNKNTLKYADQIISPYPLYFIIGSQKDTTKLTFSRMKVEFNKARKYILPSESNIRNFNIHEYSKTDIINGYDAVGAFIQMSYIKENKKNIPYKIYKNHLNKIKRNEISKQDFLNKIKKK